MNEPWHLPGINGRGEGLWFAEIPHSCCKSILQQETIPVGCQLPTCLLYLHCYELVWTYLGGPCTVRSKLKKFQHVWRSRTKALSSQNPLPSTPLWTEWQTDMTENITFPHIRCRSVMISNLQLPPQGGRTTFNTIVLSTKQFPNSYWLVKIVKSIPDFEHQLSMHILQKVINE